MNDHQKYMQQCIHLAQQGLGKVAPNPMVGSVIVHQGEIIGKGYHQKYGEAHAEVNAINSVENKNLLKEATLYVNLEPCVHFGKTPPCTDLIISHKIPNIVIGCIDPNSLMQGKGIDRLIKAGCKVTMNILEEECKELNKRFFTFHEKKRPYIILKWAQSKDGLIDSVRKEGDFNKAQQISNEASRKLSHSWRNEEQAIMIGTNTALLDNPRLTTREVQGINPIRIVIDQSLRIPESFNLFDRSTPTIVFTSVSKEAKNNLEYISIDFKKNTPELILNELYKKEIQSVIIEGGEKLLSSFIRLNLWDEARVFVSDKELMQGIKVPNFIGDISSTEMISNDTLLIYKNNSHQGSKTQRFHKEL